MPKKLARPTKKTKKIKKEIFKDLFAEACETQKMAYDGDIKEALIDLGFVVRELILECDKIFKGE